MSVTEMLVHIRQLVSVLRLGELDDLVHCGSLHNELTFIVVIVHHLYTRVTHGERM
jgi:hypothetical protein